MGSGTAMMVRALTSFTQDAGRARELLVFQPWQEQHTPTRGMFPVATESEGPSGLRITLSSPRAKSGNAHEFQKRAQIWFNGTTAFQL